jgi:transcriptional regulator with XRE-family HTH domain
MDGRRIGRALRAIRQELGWTQDELTRRSGVSQTRISSAELGAIDDFTIRTLERVAGTLGATFWGQIRWRGGDIDRLTDQDHAALVEGVISVLAQTGWLTVPEYTFNRYGERGSVDVVGWNAPSRTLLIVEVKSRLTDLQETLATFGRKLRIAPRELAVTHEWHAITTGRVLVIADTSGNRAAVSRHAATFDAVLPCRWLARPEGVLAGIWFVPITRTAAGKRVIRVRHAQSRATTRTRRARDPRNRSRSGTNPAIEPRYHPRGR